jgi:hypothetical protein
MYFRAYTYRENGAIYPVQTLDFLRFGLQYFPKVK